jgi:GLPGLI family protein
MKKTILIVLVVFISGIFVSGASYAGDKDFNGIIVYNITYEGTELDAQAQAMMPKTMKVKIKGEMSRTEISMGMGSTNVIFNGETRTSVTLMDMMGQKLAMKMTETELEEELKEGPKVEVEHSDETKEIAGYVCKKSVLKVHDKNSDKITEHVIYYTEELGKGYTNMNNPYFQSINGVMLEYSMKENNINMQFSAVSVEKKKISDDEFIIPEDYKVMSMSEFKNMFGGY